MNMQDIERKIRLMREMQRMAEEAQAEADSIKDEIKAYMGASEALSVGEYRCMHVISYAFKKRWLFWVFRKSISFFRFSKKAVGF